MNPLRRAAKQLINERRITQRLTQGGKEIKTYSIDLFEGVNRDLASDESIEIAESFCKLLCFMAQVPFQLPKEYIGENKPGNCAQTMFDDLSIVDIWLGGCEAGEFLMAVQITMAGLEHPWSPLKRPGYWDNMAQYNEWCDRLNPLLAESNQISEMWPIKHFTY